MGKSFPISTMTIERVESLYNGLPPVVVGSAVQQVMRDMRDADRGGPSDLFDPDTFHDMLEVVLLRIRSDLMEEALREAGIPLEKVWARWQR